VTDIDVVVTDAEADTQVLRGRRDRRIEVLVAPASPQPPDPESGT
jgi:hypothetical protein